MKAPKYERDETNELQHECACCRKEFTMHGVMTYYPTATSDVELKLCEACDQLLCRNPAIGTLSEDVIGQEKFDLLTREAAREWLMILLPEDMENVGDVKDYVRKLFTADWSYHLDEDAKEIICDGKGVNGHGTELFTDEEAKHLNALRDAAVAICDKANADLCGFCLDELHRLNPDWFKPDTDAHSDIETAKKHAEGFLEAHKATHDDDEAVPESEQHVMDTMKDECVYCARRSGLSRPVGRPDALRGSRGH